jgi:acyl carrier protein
MKNKKNIDIEFMRSIFKKAINFKGKLSKNSKFDNIRGWDSLGHMKIMSEIEKSLKVSFEIDEIIGVNTVNKLITLVKNKL